VDALETQAGTVFGTPRYMSPEQAQGKDIDARSDLYTLGVLLYQMLVGRAPFVDDDAVVVMARHIKSCAVPPIDAAPDAGVGAALSALVMRALAKDPGARPPSAQVFLAELDAALAEDRRGRPGGGREGGAGTSGEVAAVVHDGLGSSSAPARSYAGMPRARQGLLVTTSAAVVVSAGLFALGAFRPPQLARARAEIGHVLATRRLALLQAQAGATDRALPKPSADPAPVPAAVTVATASSGNVAPPSGKKPIRGYKKMD
jgi:serine/threonine-protein kinase